METWIVVDKQYYYPTVYEFTDAEIAMSKYEELLVGYDYETLEDGKIYIAKVERSFGELKGHVIWNGDRHI